MNVPQKNEKSKAKENKHHETLIVNASKNIFLSKRNEYIIYILVLGKNSSVPTNHKIKYGTCF